MEKCRYIPQRELPRTATAEETKEILAALVQARYKIDRRALRYVEQLWRMTPDAFVRTLCRHLQSGHRIFRKTVSQLPANTLFFSGNVGLFEDSDDEEDDVYVELRLQERTVVILYDAHEHDRWKPRFPK